MNGAAPGEDRPSERTGQVYARGVTKSTLFSLVCKATIPLTIIVFTFIAFRA